MPATTGLPSAAARRVPLPASEPPYEEVVDPERPLGRVPGRAGRPLPTQGSLALAYVLPSGVPAVPEPAAPLRLVDVPARGDPAPDPGGAERALAAFAPRRPTGSDQLPDPRRWSARLAQGIVEALHGHRPLQQLVRWTDEPVYTMLARQLAARRPSDGPRPLVRSVRVCAPSDGVVEVGVVVEVGRRCRALAMRLEGLDGRWCCTVLDIL